MSAMMSSSRVVASLTCMTMSTMPIQRLMSKSWDGYSDSGWRIRARLALLGAEDVEL
jgi:hypothetical protein